MSQTNEFAKANNPDFVYFDLQSTNTYNNDIGLAPQLQFSECRDTAVVSNAGEYNMSVTRFSVDTATLPVLVVEPDITGFDAFDPHKSIHKVAIITEGANLKIDSANAVTTTQIDILKSDGYGGMAGGRFGQSVASSDDGEVIVIGEPEANSLSYSRYSLDDYSVYASGRGQVYVGVRNALGNYSLARITDANTYRYYQDALENGINPYPTTNRNDVFVSNWRMGLNVAISGDGNIVFIGSSSVCPYYWIYNRTTGVSHRHNKTLFSTKPSRVVGALNTNGSLYIVGYPGRVTGVTSVGGIEILSFNSATGTSTSLISETGVGQEMGYAVAMNGVGNIAVFSNTLTSTAGTIKVYHSTSAPHYVSAYNNYSFTHPSTFDYFGGALSINNAGSLIVASSLLQATTGAVSVFTYASGSFGTPVDIYPDTSVSSPATFTGSISFGHSVIMSYDGSTIHVGIPNYASYRGAVQSFQYNGTSWVYKSQSQGLFIQSFYGNSLASNSDGMEYISGSDDDSNRNGVRQNRLTLLTNEFLPSTLTNTASVVNVSWISDNNTLTPPSKAQLNGVNTAIFPYYYCHSYNNFVDVVNTAIKEAYVANFNKLWTEWISTLSVTNASFIKAEFLNIVARCFSTPPYMIWNSTLDANMYLNTLFSSIGNYYVPSRTFTASGATPNTQVSVSGSPQPFNLRIAFNASLYSLFSSFPATETIIGGEKFYMLNMPKQVALLQDNSTISLRALPLIPDYPFLYEYHNSATKVITLPFPTNSVASYPLQDYFILLKQEISTIDAWCPISSIVFTSNQLPIIPSQFSSANSTGNVPNSAVIGNRFALVITDLMTNQQGYRPNIIYNPSAEYRRISLTGNMGIRNIDINVFWRSKTGQLLPFRLQSGGSATLKLLFEKKDRDPDRLKEVEPDVVDIMGGRMPKNRR